MYCYPYRFTWSSLDDPSKLACYLSGMGAVDLPLRAAFSPATHWQTFFTRPTLRLLRNRFPETCHEPGRGPSSSSHLTSREWPRLPFTARIERAHSDRARSASKKGTWPLPPILLRARVARAQKIISPHPLRCYGCATRQLWPVPRSTFKGTDSPSFFPVASISVFTRCFASSNSFSGTSKINSS